MAVSPVKRLFTTAEYYTMLQAGILTEEDRVELIEGEILQMTPIGSRHAGCVKDLVRIFSQGLGSRALLGIQDPVHLNDFSEPRPDFVVLHPREDRYRRSHPTPKDIFLLVEVADSSMGHDRSLKVPLYSRCGIPECWRSTCREKSSTSTASPLPTATVPATGCGPGIRPRRRPSRT